MNQKVVLLGRTFQTTESIDNAEYNYNVKHCGDTNDTIADAQLYAGMAAGICYESENFQNVLNQDTEKILKRAKRVSESGHYSCFEHFNVTLYIECPKIMCMLLNNMQFYSTSERSGRYTIMDTVTKREAEMYEKWLKYFTDAIKVEYGSFLSDNDIQKLAQENARYMLSVFVPTSMIYTVPISRAILTALVLKNSTKDKNSFTINYNYSIPYNQAKTFKTFTDDILSYSETLGDLILEAIGVENPGSTDTLDSLPIQNIKNIHFPLFNPNNSSKKLINHKKNDYFGDTYTANYMASFVQVAQAQRHRTINYQIQFDNNNDEDTYNPQFYIPEILKGRYMEKEWITDLIISVEEGVIPCALMVHVIEQDTVENFILKCTERMCNYAQLEIAKQTNSTLLKYYKNCNSEYALEYLSSYITKYINSDRIDTYRRCRTGYNCTKPNPFCLHNIYFNENNKLV